MDLQEDEQRWLSHLEIADNLLIGDPPSAYDLVEQVVSEIEDALRHERKPEAAAKLEQLLTHARTELARCAEARDRFRVEAEQRERRYHERELAAVNMPLDAIRRPYPPPGPNVSA